MAQFIKVQETYYAHISLSLRCRSSTLMFNSYIATQSDQGIYDFMLDASYKTILPDRRVHLLGGLGQRENAKEKKKIKRGKKKREKGLNK